MDRKFFSEPWTQDTSGRREESAASKREGEHSLSHARSTRDFSTRFEGQEIHLRRVGVPVENGRREPKKVAAIGGRGHMSHRRIRGSASCLSGDVPVRYPTVHALRYIFACVIAASAVGLAIEGCGTSSSTAPQTTSSNARADGGSQSNAAPPSDAGVTVVGQLDGGVATKLPPLTTMTGVAAVPNDDSVSITFDPIEGALDYRVYPLPADDDITLSSDGNVAVRNGTYRCAGNRETTIPNTDDAGGIPSDYTQTQVNNQMVGGYTRSLSSATLGYVYMSPGPGLVPVYALGESDPNADDECYFARWQASRSKIYTTSSAERAQLLSNFARDDGIAFYVPGTADGTTTQIYTDKIMPGTLYQESYLFPTGPEADAHPKKTPVWSLLTNQAPGSLPLMRVFYHNACGWSHDELAIGQERFNRIYKQGDKQPWWSLLWTGITQSTTLVVEALDAQCPFQGHMSPQSIQNTTIQPFHQPFLTIDQMRAASPTTEVFINGQNGPAWLWDPNVVDAGRVATQPDGVPYPPPPLPKAIARSFIQVGPQPHAPMDFFANFSPTTPPETFTQVNCGSPDQNCGNKWQEVSPSFNISFLSVDVQSNAQNAPGFYAHGAMMGEFWVTFADTSADTNGKFRMTALKKANMDPSTFLHVTMEVDAYDSSRRYPQMLISDQDAPIQYTLQNGHTIVIQPKSENSGMTDWPIDYEIELCKFRTWDVNNQCPVYDLYHVTNDAGVTTHLAPNDEVGEYASVDHRVTFDAYASTNRVYVFLEGKPYGCADLPAGAAPTGPVTVTWGDVLYHSGVDHTYAFHAAHMQIETRRHFDNLGFSSGLPAPQWDESRLPCAAPIAL